MRTRRGGWMNFSTLLGLTLLTGALASSAALAQTAPLTPDIPKKFESPTDSYDYVKRDVMIPTRDGVRRFNVVVVPKGQSNAPIILTRTPSDPASRAAR